MLVSFPGTCIKDCADANIGIMLHNNSKVDKKETRLIAVPPFNRLPACANVVPEGQVPYPHNARVRLGIFAQRRVAAHDMAIELERAMRQEALRPSLLILSVDRLAIARAQLPDGGFVDPGSIQHFPLCAG